METIVIIGAGASGLACMNELVKTNKYNIIVLEQSNKAARKILASGNGRCNVSNLNMDIKYYNHQDPLIEKLINLGYYQHPNYIDNENFTDIIIGYFISKIKYILPNNLTIYSVITSIEILRK